MGVYRGTWIRVDKRQHVMEKDGASNAFLQLQTCLPLP